MTHAQNEKIRIAIIGGGPTGLLMFKRLIDADQDFSIDIYERKQLLGAGMPYSRDGACDEHITNVSGNEIPEFKASVEEWISTEDRDTLNRFNLSKKEFNDFKVLPRLLFGRYLSDQFGELLKSAKSKNIQVTVRYATEVVDIADKPLENVTIVADNRGEKNEFDRVIICSGHHWPKKYEGTIRNYFDSPYPPAKLAHRADHPVAIRGSSLTAIDAIRTLARANGKFYKNENDVLAYMLDRDSQNFKMIMHSRNGLLPAVRFHLEDSHLSKDSVLSADEVDRIRNENDGFLPLDYVYRRNFLDPLQTSDPDFYATVAELSIEEFVDKMLQTREQSPAFDLLAKEYQEAEESIKNKESVSWKEMLAVLSFAMNYPAKYFSAEDMLRLKKTLMPLISVVIAFAPQGSVIEMMTLHKAGLLDIVSVGEDNQVIPQENGGANYEYTDEHGKYHSNYYATFVDAIGQPHLELKDILYSSLIEDRTVSTAVLKYRDQSEGKSRLENGEDSVTLLADGKYYMKVPGIMINDSFQVLDQYGAANERIYMLAVPYIGGYNPDYSGLDFGEAASERVARALLES